MLPYCNTTIPVPTAAAATAELNNDTSGVQLNRWSTKDEQGRVQHTDGPPK
eukprot:CAMPEP_0179979578 /NCGR_PEP_ID=MMETSP0983-20121128/41436_1 /TAXON_ID=483367 /ORGANISM="non described non described, Strain CCMP 2436" /LENGTH=50 /DNA_ID=CAMNT_0021897379 /DNA_START=73 /DNA_END=225 /DNA_ORIENTATION=+